MQLCSSIGSTPPIDLSDEDSDNASQWKTVSRSKGHAAKSTGVPRNSEVISLHDSDSDSNVIITQIKPHHQKLAQPATASTSSRPVVSQKSHKRRYVSSDSDSGHEPAKKQQKMASITGRNTKARLPKTTEKRAIEGKGNKSLDVVVKQESDWERGRANAKRPSKGNPQGGGGQKGKGKGRGKGERKASSDDEHIAWTDTDEEVRGVPPPKKIKINRQQYVDRIVNLDHIPTHYPNPPPNLTQAFLIDVTHDQGTRADPKESMDQVLRDAVRYLANHWTLYLICGFPLTIL
jgi:hypothetical protein